jgi:hypothetical protein
MTIDVGLTQSIHANHHQAAQILFPGCARYHTMRLLHAFFSQIISRLAQPLKGL